jgi:hypothetical protein
MCGNISEWNKFMCSHIAHLTTCVPFFQPSTPAPYVKEMNDAGQFYTNRVLKDWKEK